MKALIIPLYGALSNTLHVRALHDFPGFGGQCWFSIVQKTTITSFPRSQASLGALYRSALLGTSCTGVDIRIPVRLQDNLYGILLFQVKTRADDFGSSSVRVEAHQSTERTPKPIEDIETGFSIMMRLRTKRIFTKHGAVGGSQH